MTAVNPTGWAVCAATVAAAVCGIVWGWIEGWAVALTGTLIVLAALPYLRGARAYQAELRLPQAHTVVGRALPLEVHVQNTASRRQPAVTAELRVGGALREVGVPALPAGQSHTVRTEVPATERGVVVVGPLLLTRSDPLGVLRRELSWPEQHTVYVHPQTVVLPRSSTGLVRDLAGRASAKLTDADLSFHAVREYAAGDAMRHVHWKATAKVGTLMVRQYEETQSAHLSVLCDANPAAYDSAAGFELGVSAAASFSLQAVREGRERVVASAWVPGARRHSRDGVEVLPSRTPTELLNAWSEFDGVADARPISELVRVLAQSGRARSVVVAVTGAHTEIADVRRAAASLRGEAQLLLVRAVPLADPQVQRVHALTVLTIGALGDLPRLLARGVA